MRRLADPVGSYSEVLVGTLRNTFFVALFRKLNLGDNSSIMLVRSDGTMLARLPSIPPGIGRNLAGSDLFRHFGPAAPSGAFESVARSDGVHRLSPTARSATCR